MASRSPHSPLSDIVAPPLHRFCSRCGTSLADGRCAACVAPLASITPDDDRRGRDRVPSRRRALAALLAIILVSSVGGAAIVAEQANSRAGRAEESVANILKIVSRLEARLATQDEAGRATRVTSAGLSRRLERIETDMGDRPDTANLIASIRPSVFTVETESGSGSGFVVRSDANQSELVTNFHVLADVYRAGGRGVQLLSGDRRLTGRIAQVDETFDLALVTVAEELPALEWAQRRADPGDSVYVVGSPLGFEGTVSSGLASTYRDKGGVEYLQFSAAVNPGNSGGPVVDAAGRVLGVATMKIVGFEIEGMSFALPRERVCSSLPVCR